MTRQEAIAYGKRVIDLGLNDETQAFCELAIKALEHPEQNVIAIVPCGDTISRQAVLDGLASIAKAKAKSDAQKSLMGRVMFFTERLPSVNPQPKTGHWIVHPKGVYAHLVCDKCLTRAPYDCKTNYCPNCGAKMIEPQESEEQA